MGLKERRRSMKSLLKTLIPCLVACFMVIGLCHTSSFTSAEESSNVPVPAHEKSISGDEENGYTLTLNVKGQKETIPGQKPKVDVVLVVDQSGSMEGSKIGSLNTAMEEVIPEIRDIGEADADIKVAVLTFSSGSQWMYQEPIPIEDFKWKNVTANGVTDLGDAFSKLAGKLSRNEFLKSPTISFAPVMFLMSDGYPTDDYKEGLEKLKNNKWYKAGIKVALAIGEDADQDVLAEFTTSKEAVVTAYNGEALAKLIRFVTITSSQIGSKSMQLTDGNDENNIVTKQKAVEEQITEMKNSGDINNDFEAGW